MNWGFLQIKTSVCTRYQINSLLKILVEIGLLLDEDKEEEEDD